MEGMDWIDPAQDRDRWKALLNAVMNLRVAQNAGNFLTSWQLFSIQLKGNNIPAIKESPNHNPNATCISLRE